MNADLPTPVPDMTEDAYDEIAPEILDLAKKCKTLGSKGFVCYVSFEGGGGTTAKLSPDAPPAARLANLGARAAGNVDWLIGALVKDGKRNGHSSVYLRLLE